MKWGGGETRAGSGHAFGIIFSPAHYLLGAAPGELPVALPFWTRFYLSYLFYHYRIAFKGIGNLLIQSSRPLDNKYLYARFSFIQALACPYHAGYGHNSFGMFFKHVVNRLDRHCISSRANIVFVVSAGKRPCEEHDEKGT